MGESCCLHGCLSMMGCVGIYCGAKIREKIREKHGIPVRDERRVLSIHNTLNIRFQFKTRLTDAMYFVLPQLTPPSCI
jgi:hypothetical protein